MKLKRAFALSAVLHGALALILLLSRQPSEAPRRIIVQLGDLHSKAGGRPAAPDLGARTGLGSKPRRGIRPPDLSGFGLSRVHPGRSGDFADQGSDGNSPRSHGAGDGYDVANGMGLEQEGKLYPFFEALWRRVDRYTTYPDDFVQQRIQGKVSVQLGVDRRGVFTGEVISVLSEEPMLKAFVLVTLLHALREPLPNETWMPLAHETEGVLPVVFQFEFAIFNPGGSPKKADFTHLKNVLAFRRDAYVEPKLNQEINRILTRYFPPIIPVPGGFVIDFIRAYQFVKNLSSKQLNEDERRDVRVNLRKEDWEGLIQNETQPR